MTSGTRKEMLFHPQYCLDCHRCYISKTESNPCPFCGSGNMINWKKEFYKNGKNKMQMRESCKGSGKR